MNMASLAELLEDFETSKVIEFLAELDLERLVHNPYILGIIGGLALLCLWMRWRILLATLLSLSGFVWLLSYTLATDTSLEGGISNDTLLVFVGGGAALVFLAIYLMFVSGE